MPNPSELERERQEAMQDEGDAIAAVDALDFVSFTPFKAPEPVYGELIGGYHQRVVKAFEDYVNRDLVGLLRDLWEMRRG